MKKSLLCMALAMFCTIACHSQDSGTLENNSLTWHWHVKNGNLASTLKAKDDGFSIELVNPGFQVTLGDGTILNTADFKIVKSARTENLAVDPASPTMTRHYPGKKVVLEFINNAHHLAAIWETSLRDDSSYLQQSLTLRASGQDLLLKDIVLLDQKIPGANTEGSVDGSPIIAGRFFCGCEHPMAQNSVSSEAQVECRLTRNAVLKNGEALTESLVFGIAKPGQLRRSFLTYIERERTHPYRTFLHYNSWFDIAWDKQKFTEAQSLNVINAFGRELVNSRGVQLDSFLFDDGWDDNKTLWHFHSGFPNGFTSLKAAAASYHSGIGVWISPFGGYDEARRRRLEYGSQQGYETNSSGFSLAGPKYYELFRGICREMIQKYGVNQFKFDGLAAGAKSSESGLTRDGDAMLNLVADLRATDPNIYINQTTGTWPSPFWLLNVDSTWRGGDDHNFQGQGSLCQQWLTYRDAQTYANVVQRAPLYPLTSLMLHGIIYATNASQLASMSDDDFTAQVRSFFANGTQLQELYVTPSLLNQRNWDDLAEAANWSRRNADVLVDTHWIGGDPGKGEVYGWAAWSPRLGILTLRNPTEKPAVLSLDLKSAFELPPNSAEKFQLKRAWKNVGDAKTFEISAQHSHQFNLQPFEIMTLEAKAISHSEQAATEALNDFSDLKKVSAK